MQIEPFKIRPRNTSYLKTRKFGSYNFENE